MSADGAQQVSPNSLDTSKLKKGNIKLFNFASIINIYVPYSEIYVEDQIRKRLEEQVVDTIVRMQKTFKNVLT